MNIEVPEKCKGCGKCCMINKLTNTASIIINKNSKIPLTFHYGRCMYLNDKNECDIFS